MGNDAVCLIAGGEWNRFEEEEDITETEVRRAW